MQDINKHHSNRDLEVVVASSSIDCTTRHSENHKLKCDPCIEEIFTTNLGKLNRFVPSSSCVLPELSLHWNSDYVLLIVILFKSN